MFNKVNLAGLGPKQGVETINQNVVEKGSSSSQEFEDSSKEESYHEQAEHNPQSEYILIKGLSIAMNIPKLAINTNKAVPGLNIPQLAIPSLTPGIGKSKNNRVSSPIIASTPVNELMNVGPLST